MSLLFSQRNPKRLSKESSTKMALSRKTLYFVFAFFFTLAQLPSGCQAGMDYPYSFPGGAGLDVQGRSGEVTCLLHVTQKYLREVGRVISGLTSLQLSNQVDYGEMRFLPGLHSEEAAAGLQNIMQLGYSPLISNTTLLD
ncbi:beta-defensin 105 isoform X6 [Lemur catta]|uniref:beta-defensin 105 isoform X6 n=1 Tax=Lemur catta TaxID=9447 RepID=UPI001E2676CC|nr:beta-defensin 105 isoform X6 [Lemur catta]